MCGVLLFIPEIPSLEESRLAWHHARECCVSAVDIEVTVKVIRAFCPLEEIEGALFYGAWNPSEMHKKRSAYAWKEFASNAANDLNFTRMWWNQEENLVKEGFTMAEVVRKMATKEKEMLRFKLIANAKKELMDQKNLKAEQQKTIRQTAGKPELKKLRKTDGKPVAIRLNTEEMRSAEATAATQMEKHQHALSTLKKALAKTAVKVFDDDLAEIIASLTASFPRIKWCIKVVLHDHFSQDADWKIERQIHGHRWFTITDDPLATLGYWEQAQ
jgi:hypothetical protein